MTWLVEGLLDDKLGDIVPEENIGCNDGVLLEAARLVVCTVGGSVRTSPFNDGTPVVSRICIGAFVNIAGLAVEGTCSVGGIDGSIETLVTRDEDG